MVGEILHRQIRADLAMGSAEETITNLLLTPTEPAAGRRPEEGDKAGKELGDEPAESWRIVEVD